LKHTITNYTQLVHASLYRNISFVVPVWALWAVKLPLTFMGSFN